MRSSALVSLGRHEPPQPGPGRRNSRPIRSSYPMPRTTSFTSAPTDSQIAATALTKETLVARNAFDAYLMISAERGSVTTSGAATPR